MVTAAAASQYRGDLRTLRRRRTCGRRGGKPKTGRIGERERVYAGDHRNLAVRGLEEEKKRKPRMHENSRIRGFFMCLLKSLRLLGVNPGHCVRAAIAVGTAGFDGQRAVRVQPPFFGRG